MLNPARPQERLLDLNKVLLRILNQYKRNVSEIPLRALDVGCGNGSVSIFLAQQGMYVDALDRDTSQIQQIRDFIALHQDIEHRLRLFVTDCREFRYPKEHYDLIVCANVLHLLTREEYKEILAIFWQTAKRNAPVVLLFKRGSQFSPTDFGAFYRISIFASNNEEYIFAHLRRPRRRIKLTHYLP
jgi:cyclopropane fatty-acyl-phospholipid synthase-like methyltransferase